MNSVKKEKRFAFNVWDIESAKAIIDASVARNKSIYLQMSTSVFSQIDVEAFTFVVKKYRESKKCDVILHLDHASQIKYIQEAIKFGWDSVMFDGSHLSLADNIKMTNEVSSLAKEQGVLVEAEIGVIPGQEDDLSVHCTQKISFENVMKFSRATSVDLLAVALGTVHGSYGNKTPQIDYKLLKKLEGHMDQALVVHGGSGLSSEVLLRLFKFNNVYKINISTDVKQAYRLGIQESIKNGWLLESGFNAMRVQNHIKKSIREMAISKFEVLDSI